MNDNAVCNREKPLSFTIVKAESEPVSAQQTSTPSGSIQRPTEKSVLVKKLQGALAEFEEYIKSPLKAHLLRVEDVDELVRFLLFDDVDYAFVKLKRRILEE